MLGEVKFLTKVLPPTFHRKAKAFQPDMVIYSSTMLDPRLLEIHLSGLFAALLVDHYLFQAP